MEKVTYTNSDDELPFSVKVKKLDTYVYVRDLPYKRYAWQERWQRTRPDWLSQCAGEFFGVFCYCYAGLGAQAALFLSEATDNPAIGSLFTVGAAYAAGIAFAITTGGMSSGAQFNPAFSIAMATWRDVRWERVPRYIAAQLLGAFVAGLIVYCQYRPYLKAIEAGMLEAGKGAAIISARGPAGVFAFYPAKDISLGWVFANEFFVDFFIALVVWGAIDYSSIFSSPATVPMLIGLAYGVSIWSYAPATVALNPARDLASVPYIDDARGTSLPRSSLLGAVAEEPIQGGRVLRNFNPSLLNVHTELLCAALALGSTPYDHISEGRTGEGLAQFLETGLRAARALGQIAGFLTDISGIYIQFCLGPPMIAAMDTLVFDIQNYAIHQNQARYMEAWQNISNIILFLPQLAGFFPELDDRLKVIQQSLGMQ